MMRMLFTSNDDVGDDTVVIRLKLMSRGHDACSIKYVNTSLLKWMIFLEFSMDNQLLLRNIYVWGHGKDDDEWEM